MGAILGGITFGMKNATQFRNGMFKGAHTALGQVGQKVGAVPGALRRGAKRVHTAISASIGDITGGPVDVFRNANVGNIRGGNVKVNASMTGNTMGLVNISN